LSTWNIGAGTDGRPLPKCFLESRRGAAPIAAELIKIADGTRLVVGIGQPTTFALKRTVPGIAAVSYSVWRCSDKSWT